MRHTQLNNTAVFDRDRWIKHFCITHKTEDCERVQWAIDSVLTADNDEWNSFPSSVDVADILLNLQVDQATITATLLSDYRLLNKIDFAEVSKQYGDTIGLLVENVDKLHKFNDCRHELTHTVPEQAERLRRMLLAMVDDIRAVLIKLAWRLQHLRILKQAPSAEQFKIARDTMDIFAPLANRLGISQVKWEMEDLAFRYLEPVTYKKIAKALAANRIARENYIKDFIQTLQSLLDEAGVKAKVYGRPKHIYSIWKKMQKKHKSIDQLFDLRAVRIIVDKTEACYRVLGIVHERWNYIDSEYDDYIANRKPNGYQSLHTVVVGPKNKAVEIQIRTEDMHAFAELGVAAHWRYKEGGSKSSRQDASMERTVSSLRRLLDADETDDELLDDFRKGAFPDRVFVLTPKGDVMDLRKGATPLDLAYAIHTRLGHRCKGAIVNDSMSSLTYPLKNGDIVRIITRKEEAPNRDWLNSKMEFLKTPRARSSVRHWFRQQSHEQNRHDGQLLLDKERRRLKLKQIDTKALVQHFRLNRENDLLIALGRGDIGLGQLINALKIPEIPETHDKILKSVKVPGTVNGDGLLVHGVEDLLTQMAPCCNPVPGDDIIGFITLGRGVTIHRADCPNVANLRQRKETRNRLTDVEWGQQNQIYPVNIKLMARDRPGLLSEVTQILAAQRVNISHLDSDVNDDKEVTMNMGVQIHDTAELSVVLNKLAQLPNIIEVFRQV